MRTASISILLILSVAQVVAWSAPAPEPFTQPALSTGDFVELQRTACLGFCPDYTVRIRADGQVTWSGNDYVAAKGKAISSIASDQARALIDKFRANGFWDLDDSYSRRVTDNATMFTVLHIGGREKRVSNYAAAAPAWLQGLEDEIDVVANTHQWIHGDPRKELMTGFNLHVDGRGGKPGVTALMRAGFIADTAAIRTLLATKTDPDAQDSSGWTALVYAAQGAKNGIENAETFSSGIEAVKLLLDAGANPNLHSFMDQTPLMSAVVAYYSPVEKARLLIAAGANVNTQDKNGKTALMLLTRGALQRQQVQLFPFLKAAGAKTDLRDSGGFSVFDLLDQELQRYSTADYSQDEIAGFKAQYEEIRRTLKN